MELARMARERPTMPAALRAAESARAEDLRIASPRLVRLLRVALEEAGDEGGLWAVLTGGLERRDDDALVRALGTRVDESSAS